MAAPRKQARKLSKEERENCRMVTPMFRLSYPHLFEAHAMDDKSAKKFSFTGLIPKDKGLKGLARDGSERSLRAIVKNAANYEFGSKEEWPDDLELPIRDGDSEDYFDAETGQQKEGYAGHWVIKATSSEEQRPSVVDKNMDPISEPGDLYPGCYARAYVLAYVWYFGKKKGVGFIVDHVQKMKEGKPFGSKVSAANVFSPVSLDEDEDEDEDESDDGQGFM